MAICSFFPAHHITSIEGGSVTTNWAGLAASAKSLVSWGRSCYCEPGQANTCGHRFDWPERGDLPEGYDHKYIFDGLGYNLKMDEFRAALGNSQLNRLSEFVNARRDNWFYMFNALYEDVKQISIPYPRLHDFSPFGLPIRENTGRAKDLIAYLERHKIATRRIFAGNIIRQPMMYGLEYVCAGDLSGSDDVMNNMFWIGCCPSITKDMMDYVIETISEFYNV